MMRQIMRKNRVKPILKWAGGKTQLLDKLLEEVPQSFGNYIEPFFGGGALFFAIQPKQAIISDNNPELINLYREIAANPSKVIEALQEYKNEKELFYEVRAQKWENMQPYEAAARTIFLNRTCFNGLYRVNKKGGFNVPYGNYKNPLICNQENIYKASEALKEAKIICGDYRTILRKYAQTGDFVYLDPPYVPVSKNSDFKRYTKEQFSIGDHRDLVDIVDYLNGIGCKVLITNSDTPIVRELYKHFNVKSIETKRHISCKGDSRRGKDLIVTV